MSGFFSGAALALWLGVLTSISPCPLATNIAAVSFVGRHVGSPRRVLAAGLIYTAGRTLVYLVLAGLLVTSLLEAPYVSHLLQKDMNRILGPVLVVAGMFLLDLIRIAPLGGGRKGKLQERVERSGFWGAALLGIVFALSFCPVSAALFFGSLVPLAVRSESAVLYPLLYGVGTALPVVLFAGLISAGARHVGLVFDRIKLVEIWARRATGIFLAGLGIYFSLKYIFQVI